MKVILSFMLIALFSVISYANVTADNQYLLNHATGVPPKAQLGTLMNGTRNLLVARYSYAVQGGSSTSSPATDIKLITDLTNPKSYATLPANAIITNAWMDVLTVPGSKHTAATIRLYVKNPSSADLLAAGGTAGGIWLVGQGQLTPAGTTTTFIKIASTATGGSTIKMRVGVAPPGLNAGKFNVYIEYVLGGTTN